MINIPLELNELLKKTSRSFFLTLNAVPAKIRPHLSIAYLLARAADTIADTDALAEAQKLAYLERLQTMVRTRPDDHKKPADFCRDLIADLTKLSSKPANISQAEYQLLLKFDDVLNILFLFERPDQELIGQVLSVIISGQISDIKKFNRKNSKAPSALESLSELDEYTYKVAGCVGEFWTQLCLKHLFKLSQDQTQQMLNYGISYGKALQLINVLRDLKTDLKNGRCYIPVELLSQVKLQPQDLMNPGSEPLFKPVFYQLLSRAAKDLITAYDYVAMIPPRFIQLRLATLWPAMIGIKTLRKLHVSKILDHSVHVKISRSSLWRSIILSFFIWPFPKLLKRQVQSFICSIN